jgi:DNA-binding PadR family transcriptional regulator
MKTLTRQEELILLAVYHLRETAYLVTIRRFLKERTGRPWSVGAVYVPLERLHKKGYLESYLGGPNARRGRNEVKYYRLTPNALEALSERKQVNDLMWARFSESDYSLQED